MYKLKNILKFVVGYIRCKLKKLKYSKGIYLGQYTKFINSKMIIIGKDVQIRNGVQIYAGEKIHIGEKADIGERNRIAGNVIIGSSVLLGPANHISSETHCYEDVNIPIMLQGAYNVEKNGHKELSIGDGSWIGTHCAIIGCVHIGKNCVVGANSVVTKDVPDYSVVVGNPARIVKQYDIEKGMWLNIKYEDIDVGKLEN